MAVNFNILSQLAGPKIVGQIAPTASEGDDFFGGLQALMGGAQKAFGGSTSPSTPSQVGTPFQGINPGSSVAQNVNMAVTSPSSLNSSSKLQQIVTNAMPLTDDLKKTPAFQSAFTAHQKALEAGVTKSPVMTVVDYSRPSNEPRMWVVDTANNKVLLNTTVAQGKTPGFSNIPNSKQSSLGTFLTGNPYQSASLKREALKLQGLNPGVNDKAFERGIVIHGGNYVGKDRAGTSWGCFTVANDVAPTLIGLTKGGTIVHAFAPDSKTQQNFSNQLSPAGKQTFQQATKMPIINNVIQSSQKVYQDNPVMGQVAAAQAILESGLQSGKPSRLAGEYNNYFGIKGRGTAGSSVMSTKEYGSKGYYSTNAAFARNATPEDSFVQHRNLMMKPRYKDVMNASSFEEAVMGLQKAGYATDPQYAKKLIEIRDRYLQGAPTTLNDHSPFSPQQPNRMPYNPQQPLPVPGQSPAQGAMVQFNPNNPMQAIDQATPDQGFINAPIASNGINWGILQQLINNPNRMA